MIASAKRIWPAGTQIEIALPGATQLAVAAFSHGGTLPTDAPSFALEILDPAGRVKRQWSWPASEFNDGAMQESEYPIWRPPFSVAAQRIFDGAVDVDLVTYGIVRRSMSFGPSSLVGENLVANSPVSAPVAMWHDAVTDNLGWMWDVEIRAAFWRIPESTAARLTLIGTPDSAAHYFGGLALML